MVIFSTILIYLTYRRLCPRNIESITIYCFSSYYHYIMEFREIQQKRLQPQRPSTAIARRNFRYAGKRKGISLRAHPCALIIIFMGRLMRPISCTVTGSSNTSGVH